METTLDKRKINQSSYSIEIKKILSDVKNQGDKAVIKFEKNFQKIKTKPKKIKFSKDEINKISMRLIKN